jgi:DNA-binding NarL/FixJ family response regulator
MSNPLRVVIADDHALFRQGLKSLLELDEALTVAGEVERIEALPALLDQTPCDLLLLDLEMERSTLDDIPRLAARQAVIVVTASERTEDAVEALRAGARGVVLKRFAIETLMAAIQAVRAGHVWVPPEVQACLAERLREPARDLLTPREREVVRHVALGLRNAEVARKLFVSEVTIKTHLNNVFQKLGIRDRVELTRYAIRVGIVSARETRS